MFALLSTLIVLGALSFFGYRVTMYLYSQGVVGVGSRQVQYAEADFSLVQPAREVALEERDYGLRYARVGLLVIASIVVILVVSVIAMISVVLYGKERERRPARLSTNLSIRAEAERVPRGSFFLRGILKRGSCYEPS